MQSCIFVRYFSPDLLKVINRCSLALQVISAHEAILSLANCKIDNASGSCAGGLMLKHLEVQAVSIANLPVCWTSGVSGTTRLRTLRTVLWCVLSSAACFIQRIVDATFVQSCMTASNQVTCSPARLYSDLLCDMYKVKLYIAMHKMYV